MCVEEVRKRGVLVVVPGRLSLYLLIGWQVRRGVGGGFLVVLVWECLRRVNIYSVMAPCVLFSIFTCLVIIRPHNSCIYWCLQYYYQGIYQF